MSKRDAREDVVAPARAISLGHASTETEDGRHNGSHHFGQRHQSVDLSAELDGGLRDCAGKNGFFPTDEERVARGEEIVTDPIPTPATSATPRMVSASIPRARISRPTASRIAARVGAPRSPMAARGGRGCGRLFALIGEAYPGPCLAIERATAMGDLRGNAHVRRALALDVERRDVWGRIRGRVSELQDVAAGHNLVGRSFDDLELAVELARSAADESAGRERRGRARAELQIPPPSTTTSPAIDATPATSYFWCGWMPSDS